MCLLQDRVLAQLPSFRALRTLSLEYIKSGDRALPPGMQVDTSGVPTLKHFAIVNWYADSIWGPEGCKLHASYDPTGSPWPSDAVFRFVSSGMWASKFLPLASLYLIWQKGAMSMALSRLNRIPSQAGPLEFVLLGLGHAFWNSKMPFEISEQRWRGLLTCSNLNVLMLDYSDCILRVSSLAAPGYQH
jgi:hypothetical protein